MLANCSPAPETAAPVAAPDVEALPTPPVAPRAVPIPPSQLSALRAGYADAAARLRVYLTQPPCAPAGVVACVDRDQATIANEAQRRAFEAIKATERREAALRVAQTRVDAFRAVVGGLPLTE